MGQTLQGKFGFGDGDLKTPKHDEIMLWLDRNIQQALKPFVPDAPSSSSEIVYYKTWECAIKNGGYLVGFIDMRVSTFVEGPDQQIGHKTIRRKDFLKCFHIEVKSTIPSLGELIRQIRMYQAYDDIENDKYRPTYIVVSPDTRFADAIKSQGIEFVEYIPQGQLF